MSENQLNLPLFRSRTGPSTPATDAVDLRAFLQGRGWTAGADLVRLLGWPERRVRAAAEAARGEILSGPGSPGYILTRDASANDRESIVAALRSQARRMIGRSLAISRVHHATG
jgi:hypothetical protein